MDEQTIIDYEGIGAKFKHKRLQLGLTQEKVAEKLNIEESYYSRIERGHRALSLENLVKLAEFYDLSIDWLLDNTRDSDSKLLADFEAVFRDKSPSESALLLNLLKIHAENVGRIIN